MSAASTFIACASPADAARLANLLTSPSAWTGLTPPDLVFDNNGQVELTWNVVSAPHPGATVIATKGSIPTTTITHRNASGSTTAKFT